MKKNKIVFFYLSKEDLLLIRKFKTKINKIGFILQYGYFKAVNKFFLPKSFHKKDIEYINSQLDFNNNQFSPEICDGRTFYRHKKIILNKLGFLKFNIKSKKNLIKETNSLVLKHIKPRTIFFILINYLKSKKIEIPKYNTFVRIITISVRNFEKDVLKKFDTQLSYEDKKLLDGLITPKEEDSSAIKKYKFQSLKKINHSIRPLKIKKNVDDLIYLKNTFHKIKPIINKLKLSSKSIKYYAQIVIKSKTFQITQRKKSRYLILVSFISYQYYILNDIIVDILVKAIQNKLNSIERLYKNYLYDNRKEINNNLKKVTKTINTHFNLIEKIKKI